MLVLPGRESDIISHMWYCVSVSGQRQHVLRLLLLVSVKCLYCYPEPYHYVISDALNV